MTTPNGPVIERFDDLAARILAMPQPIAGGRLVAIDGPSGAGKTEFARHLADAVARMSGTPASVFSADDILDGWGDQSTFFAKMWDTVVLPLRLGQTASYGAYNWATRTFTGKKTLEPAEVVIMEGSSVGRAQLRPLLSLLVFIDAPQPKRRRRVYERDGAVESYHLDAWMAAENKHFSADETMRHADLVVDGLPAVDHDATTQYVLLPR